MNAWLTSTALVAAALAAGCSHESMAAVPDARRSFQVEIDVLDGVELDASELPLALDVARQAFASVDIDVSFDVSNARLRGPARLVEASDKTRVLDVTRDRDEAVHVVVATRGAGAHGVVHYDKSADASPRSAGVILFARSIADDFAANPLLARAGLERGRLLGRSLAHELGHALGCPHPDVDDEADAAVTVMGQNSQLGAITSESLERWKRALLDPRFDSPACLDLAARLSVELARPAYSQ